jgi:hypothetical protein
MQTDKVRKQKMTASTDFCGRDFVRRYLRGEIFALLKSLV